MNIDLNINGGFVLKVKDDMDEDSQSKIIRSIESEVNSALSMIAYRHGLGFSSVELQED